jgi:murein DD-endopeptidase MepM/ murein hydrolase activator NlpD
MHQTDIWERSSRFVTFLLLSISIFSLTFVSVVQADWRSKYDQQKQEVNSQMDEVNSELSDMKKKMTEISTLKGSLKEQVATSEAEIAKIEGLIEETRLSISKLKAQIDYKQQELDELEEQMRSILKEIQKQQRVSPVELVLTSKSLGEAVGKVYNLSSLQVKADELKTEVQETKAELEENKAQLEESKQTLEDSKALAESKKSSLEQLLVETEGEEAKYQAWVSALKDQQQQLSAREAEINQEIANEEERRRQQEAAQNPGGGGGGNAPGPIVVTPGNCSFEDGGTINANLIKPTAGVMTDNFGCPTMWGVRWHDGIDIAHGIGTPIKATASGVIYEKGNHPGGYGYYVIVKHTIGGQRFYSLYAHMNAPSNRGVGEYVNQGDRIGSMGNTGWSTGSHLHFALLSQTFESTRSPGCVYGSSKCYNPARFIAF